MPLLKIQPIKFYVAVICCALGQIMFWYVLIGPYRADSETVFGLLLFAVLLATFFYLFYKGYNWSRWVLMILLLFLGVTSLIDGVTVSHIVYVLSGIAHLAALVNVFLSARVSKGDPLPVIDMEPADLHDEPEVSTPVNTGNFIQDGVSYDYPPLVTRYKAVLVDFLILFAVLIITMVTLGESEYRSPVMITLGLLAVFVYDPVLTAYSATIGQRLMGIRVRRFGNPAKRVGIVSAYARAIVKVFLGWLSFLTINFNPEHRAIHDFAGGSVVVRSQ